MVMHNELENRICRQIQDLHANFWYKREKEARTEVVKLHIGQEVAYVLSFYPRVLKLSLFQLYGQPFSRYGLILKIAIFGHETWNLKKVPEVAYGPFSTPRGRN